MFDVSTARLLADRELQRMIETASSLQADDWTRPTGCAGWNVAQLCSHAGLTAHRQAEAFRRAAEGVLDPPEFPAAPDLPPPEIVNQLREGARALDAALAALPADVLGGATPMPFGVVPTVVAIQIPVHEYAVHGHDLRSAVNDPSPFPDDVAGALLEFFPGLAAMLAARAQPGTRTHAYRLTGASTSFTLAPDGAHDPPTCEIAGPDAAVALFAMGRVTTDDPRLTIDGPDAVAAAAEFKRWYPGP